MSQYIRKGNIARGKHYKLANTLIALFDEKWDISQSLDLSKVLFYFLQLCKNGDIKLTKSTLERALNECYIIGNTKCKKMLTEYIEQEND